MQGKKSFLLYCDMINLFEELDDEQAGRLIKHVFKYVNDQDPVMEDQLLKIAFVQIKNVLKKDLEEWLRIRERNIENGKRGGRPKNPEEPKEPNGFSGNPEEPKKPVKVKVKDMVINNKAFAADANADFTGYRLYLFNCIKEMETSRDALFMKQKIDRERRNEIWEDFISNSVQNTPRIEDSRHAWNLFKKFIIDNSSKYTRKKQTTNWE